MNQNNDNYFPDGAVSVDIEKLIRDDLIQQYNQLRVMYSQEQHNKSNLQLYEKIRSDSYTKEQDLADACEIFAWSQTQKDLALKPVGPILLPNAVIDTNNETTMVHYLCRSNCLSILELLLKNNIDINIYNKKGFMPMHYAILHKQKSTILWLLQHGAQDHIFKKYNNAPCPLLYNLNNKEDKGKNNILFNIYFGQSESEKINNKRIPHAQSKMTFQQCKRIPIPLKNSPLIKIKEINDSDSNTSNYYENKCNLKREFNTISVVNESKKTKTIITGGHFEQNNRRFKGYEIEMSNIVKE